MFIEATRADADTPTIALTDLVKDRCNFTDRTFEQFVDDVMAHLMPGFPLQILDTESENAHEEWEIEQRDPEQYITCVIVEATEEGLHYEAWRPNRQDEPELTPEQMKAYIGRLADTVGDELAGLEPGEDVEFFFVDYDGEEFDSPYRYAAEADEVVEDAINQSFHGFPWAWNWCWYPDDRVRTEDLQACGFVVASYREYRLCGIDGGGYTFKGAHFAPLVYTLCKRWNLEIPTDKGPRRFA